MISLCPAFLLLSTILIVSQVSTGNAEKHPGFPVVGTILVTGLEGDTFLMSSSSRSIDTFEEDGLHVEIYDLNGRSVFRDSVSRLQTLHSIAWSGKDDHNRRVPAGYYWYRIDADGASSPSPIASPSGDLYFWDVTASRMPADSTHPWDMECGDVDNDGDVDIIIGCQEWSGPGQLRLLINDGTGHFADETEARLSGIQARTTDIGLADIDGDGDLDMFVTDADAGQEGMLLINNGHGFFNDEASLRLPRDNAIIVNIVFADIDGDNDQDIAGVAFDPEVSLYCEVRIFLNDGEGFFVKDADRTLPLKTSLWNIAAADVDGDGDMDLLLPAMGEILIPDDTLSGQTSLLINDGLGWFSDQTEARMPVDPVTSTKKIIVGDIDSDGDVDLYLANIGFGTEQAKDRLYINDGQGHFFDETGSRLSGQPVMWTDDARCADFDLDGDLDIFVADVVPGGYAFDELLLNDGTGVFKDQSNLLPEIFDFTTTCVAGDLDGDTDVDIITANSVPTADSRDGQDRLYMNMLVSGTDMPRGDVNNDGHVDVTDVYLCVRIITHGYKPHYPEFLRADLNRDGAVNALDAVSMIRVILQGP